MALTDVEIRKSKPAKAQYKMADSHGLYLAVTPQGNKIWRWKYYFEGKERSMSFGRYPEVSLTLARKRHADGRSTLAEGVDPVAIRKAEKAGGITEGITFQKVAEEWHQHWSVGKSPRHADYVLRRLKGDIFPAIGHVPITEVEAPALVSLLKAIEGRGANDIAKRALEMTGQVFRYAIAHGKATRNPAADFKPRDVLKSVPTAIMFWSYNMPSVLLRRTILEL